MFSDTIELRAWGYDDTDRKFNLVRINGNELTRLTRRGLMLVIITKDCKAGEITTYDTHGSTSAADKLRDYLTNLPNNTRLAGISHDSFMRSLESAKPILNQLGVDLSDHGYRTSLCFYVVKGKPEEIVQSNAARFKGPTTLSTPLTCET